MERRKKPYLTTEQLSVLWRHMTSEEVYKANQYIEVVTAELSVKAKAAGKDLDELAQDDDYYRVLQSVIADVVARVLMTSTDSEPMSQMSQSAGGYTFSGTYLVPGGGLFIKRSELARLGLKRQTYGAVDVYA